MPGLIRPARRPPGWVAPGPPPRGPQGRPELEPKPDEDLCYLSGDWRLFQKLEGHRWSIDDLVTAWQAAPLAPVDGAALDLGCGLGSVLLMLAWRRPDLRVLGVEAQEERAAMARRSIAYNGVEDRCQVEHADVRAFTASERFSLVTGTPPYFPLGTGTEAGAHHVSACRFEHRGGVEAYLAAAEQHLGDDGTFVMCAASLEDDRVRAAPTSLALRGRLEIVPREGKAPLLSVWTFSRRPGAHDDRRLTVRDRHGQWTPAFRAVREEMGLPALPPGASARSG